MAEHISKLADKGFQNWIKANLALNITKEGIEAPVLNEIVAFHQDTLNDILSPEQILNNELCSQCKNENILPCPTRGICIVKTGLCSFHYCQEKRYRPCPKHVCDRLREKIKQCHLFHSPSWKNTNAEGWCQNPWEMAKCYLPPDGYLSARSIAETDINGIISVIMNHSAFKSKVDMDSCYKVREISKRLRHSPDLCIDDQTFNIFLETLVEFFSLCLFHGDLKAAASVRKLNKLKAESLIIKTDDVTKVLQDVIDENTRKSLQEINEKVAEHASKLKASLDKLETVTSTNLMDIVNAKNNATDDIDSKRKGATDDIESTFKRLKSEANKDIDQAKIQAVREIEHLKQISPSSYAGPLSEADYQCLKSDFKFDLLTFNQHYHSTIPLSPVFEEHDTSLLEFCVQPTLNSIEVQKKSFTGPAVEERTPVKSLQNVFYKRSKRCANVYLTSGAGQGKTVFCQDLVLKWCHAHGNKNRDSRSFAEEDLRVMKHFEYVFLVSLRDTSVHCDVDDMIANQIVQYLAQSSKYTQEFMQTLLHREQSLVLLDGLDEYSHPTPSVSACNKKQDGLPHRKVRPNCTILTTTRTWKLSVVDLKSSQIDNHIEIGNLDEASSRQLIANAVRKILDQDGNGGTKETDVINSQIEETTAEIVRSTPEFEMNPLLLTYMICLLCNGKSLGRSKCELYANIIDFLLHRWEKRNNKITNTAENAFDSVLLPAVLRKYNHIRTYEKFLLSLGQLAFKALFCENKERSLVFESSLMDSCLSEEQQKFCLSTGLLVQNKLPGRLIMNETTVSFSHKTFQEFFAALYIQSNGNISEVIEPMLKKCKNMYIESILEMSNVFIFLGGLCPEGLSVLSKDLCKAISGDDTITQFRSGNDYFFADTVDKSVTDLQNMYIACAKESQEADHETVYPVLEDIIIDRDRYEEEYFQLLQNLIKTNIENIKSIYLTNCESETDTRELIRNLNLKNIHTLESLQLTCPIVSEDLDQILAGSIDTLHQLTAYSLMWSSGSMLNMNSTLSDTSIKVIREMISLTTLQLTNFRMSHDVLESLLSHLTQRTCMKHLLLANIECTEHGELCPGFSVDLSRHVQLITVGLCNLPLVHVEINTSALERCVVGPLQTVSAVSSFLKCLLNAEKLRLVICYSMRNDSDLNTMIATIQKLVTVTEIVIMNTDIKNKVLQLPSENIELMRMLDTTMESSSLEQLAQQVEQLHQSVHIELQDCTVTPEEEYEKIKCNIKSSDRFEVICDGEQEDTFGWKWTSFKFKTIKA